MDAQQAGQVVTLIKAAVGGRADIDTLDYFEARLMQLDYEPALAAATTGSVVWRWFPSWSEFFDQYGVQVRLRENDDLLRRSASAERSGTSPTPPTKKEMPFWVKRWFAARYLYARFGRDQDMRPFREMAEFVDPRTAEWMPEEEWAAEATGIREEEVYGGLTA